MTAQHITCEPLKRGLSQLGFYPKLAVGCDQLESMNHTSSQDGDYYIPFMENPNEAPRTWSRSLRGERAAVIAPPLLAE